MASLSLPALLSSPCHAAPGLRRESALGRPRHAPPASITGRPSQSQPQRRAGPSLSARAVQLGGASAEEHTKAKAGDRVKVTAPVLVFHVPKTPELQLEGMEGTVQDVLGVWKGVEVSANLPYRVQFVRQEGESATKFFAHLKDDEFEVL